MQINASQHGSYQDIKGGSRVPPGRYHVQVESCEEKDSRLEVKFKVLNGTIPDQAGREHRENFSTSEKAMPRLERFAMVLGLIQPGQAADVNFAQAIGRDLVIELVEGKEYQRKKDGIPQCNDDGSPQMVTPIQISWAGTWPTSDPEVGDVPRGASPQPAAPAPAATQQPAPQPAAASGGSWDDI